MDAFGIFEGGGAKGLAHAAALGVAERYRVRFLGVAGASAGAIAAALVAVGYKAQDLHVPHGLPSASTSSQLLDIDFTTLLGKTNWKRWRAFGNHFKNAFLRSETTWFMQLWRTLWFAFRNPRMLYRVATRKGLFSTDRFRDWIEPLLRAKITANTTDESDDSEAATPQGRVLFRDLGAAHIPLKIIATDLSEKVMVVFSKETTPDVAVADAIAASIAIPLFFEPKGITMSQGESPRYFVDGGLMSNFPAWVFDDERRNAGPTIASLGFRLIGPRITPRVVGIPAALVGYLGRLLITMLDGDEHLHVREIDNLHIVPMHVPSSTFDFDMTNEKKKATYDAANSSCQNFFAKYIGAAEPAAVEGLLRTFHGAMLHSLNTGKMHLRVNVVTATARKTLRVSYTFNMTSDADDRLEFPIGSGASGECWATKLPVACDLLAARSTFSAKWKLDKYQQAYVRPTLVSLLCVPIFPYEAYLSGLVNNGVRPSPIAVLNFDSDDIDLKALSTAEIMKRVEDQIAPVLSYTLRPQAAT